MNRESSSDSTSQNILLIMLRMPRRSPYAQRKLKVSDTMQTPIRAAVGSAALRRPTSLRHSWFLFTDVNTSSLRNGVIDVRITRIPRALPRMEGEQLAVRVASKQGGGSSGPRGTGKQQATAFTELVARNQQS